MLEADAPRVCRAGVVKVLLLIELESLKESRGGGKRGP